MRIYKSNLEGSVQIIGSKSYAHRALICAAFLAKEPVKLYNVTLSDDIKATINCLKSLNAGVDFCEDHITITPPESLPSFAVLNVSESASTLRFLMPIASALGVSCQFICSQSLQKRPNKPVIDLLTQNGVKVSDYKISGKLTGDSMQVDASLSSQFLSGLMLAAPLINKKTAIYLKGKIVSSGYINITIDVLKSFGVNVERTGFGYIVSRSDDALFNPCLSYAIEGDWSNAAPYFVLGALGGNIMVKGLNPCSVQGDIKILDILKQSGAKVTIKDYIKVEKGQLKPLAVDAENIPDMVPILCALASDIEGESKILNVSRLKLKESDRIEQILSTLQKVGVKAEYIDGNLIVCGGKLKSCDFAPSNDHRIIMMQTVLGLLVGNVSIQDAAFVAKSYPDFFKDLSSLGGVFDGNL